MHKWTAGCAHTPLPSAPPCPSSVPYVRASSLPPALCLTADPLSSMAFRKAHSRKGLTSPPALLHASASHSAWGTWGRGWGWGDNARDANGEGGGAPGPVGAGDTESLRCRGPNVHGVALWC